VNNEEAKAPADKGFELAREVGNHEVILASQAVIAKIDHALEEAARRQLQVLLFMPSSASCGENWAWCTTMMIASLASAFAGSSRGRTSTNAHHG
jgi:hypothetical protein